MAYIALFGFGFLMGLIAPHHKLYIKIADLYQKATKKFIKAMRRRGKKINRLMVERNELKQRLGEPV